MLNFEFPCLKYLGGRDRYSATQTFRFTAVEYNWHFYLDGPQTPR